MTDGFYVTWGASEGGGVMAPGQSLPLHGKSLGLFDCADLRQVIHKRSCMVMTTGSWTYCCSGRCLTEWPGGLSAPGRMQWGGPMHCHIYGFTHSWIHTLHTQDLPRINAIDQKTEMLRRCLSVKRGRGK
ncbi:unnamed protein product [Coregonus sp. 'balchen']|nr:unnamed protein product [Coregonus sp. 'balchen']